MTYDRIKAIEREIVPVSVAFATHSPREPGSKCMWHQCFIMPRTTAPTSVATPGLRLPAPDVDEQPEQVGVATLFTVGTVTLALFREVLAEVMLVVREAGVM